MCGRRDDGEVWADLLEPVTATVIARYADGSRHYRGTPAMTVNPVGQGRVYYLGTSPDPRGLFFVYRRIFKEAGLKPRFFGEGIEVIERRTADSQRVTLILNHTNKAKRVLGQRVEAHGMAVVPGQAVSLATPEPR